MLSTSLGEGDLDWTTSPWVSVILPEPTACMRLERRTGQCWEATRALTQWPRPMQGDAAHPPFIRLPAESPHREGHQSAKSWGRGGKAPETCPDPKAPLRN